MLKREDLRHESAIALTEKCARSLPNHTPQGTHTCSPNATACRNHPPHKRISPAHPRSAPTRAPPRPSVLIGHAASLTPY
jgi:hypothetical protein